jgi:Ran GTPase-activating protein (RanGAP) involved in mRNA processing and transport
MSKISRDYPEITTELVEKHMRQARIERSKVVWDLLQSVFSRPEHSDEQDVKVATKSGFRLG